MNIIRKMKSNGSPCPLDQILVIAFKRSVYLHSYLTKIIQVAWCNCAILKDLKSTAKKTLFTTQQTFIPSHYNQYH